ncbi:hypothetical protein ACFQFH_15720 [Halobaculum halobium]|uniref:DUF35 domain-containing protein n=1 Tax=Halobaculum halobium TaxID=3032281 RepID=A0ABD5THY5_9EURY|nr:hypothetical protein [Halobaculum sp. SYNS20]
MSGHDRGPGTRADDCGSGAGADDRDGDPPADRAFGCRECGRRWYYTKPQCPDCGSEPSSHATAELGEERCGP